jgi:hypothetical protein
MGRFSRHASQQPRPGGRTLLTLHFSSGPGMRTAYPCVIFSGPIEDALAKMKADIATLRSVAPEAAALPALERHSMSLAQAIEKARSMDATLTVDEIAGIERVSAQAVRKRLEKGHYPGAEKRGGVWRIPKDALESAA